MFKRWQPDELETLLDHLTEQEERERKARVVSELEQKLQKMKGRA